MVEILILVTLFLIIAHAIALHNRDRWDAAERKVPKHMIANCSHDWIGLQTKNKKLF